MRKVAVDSTSVQVNVAVRTCLVACAGDKEEGEVKEGMGESGVGKSEG